MVKKFLADLHTKDTIIQVGPVNKIMAISGTDKLDEFMENNQDKDLYFLANVDTDKQYKRASDDDIKKKKYVYFDFDIRKEQPDITDEHIKEMGVCWGQILNETKFNFWSYIVFSGNGLHIYYIGDACDVDKEKYSLGYDIFRKKIENILEFEADVSCRNVGRIARIPGSYNNKKKKKLVEIVSHQNKKYNIVELIQTIGGKEQERTKSIETEESALREYAVFEKKYKSDVLVKAINEIKVSNEIEKDYPQWKFDNKNFWQADGERAASSWVNEKNVLIVSDSRWFSNIKNKGVGTFLYRREMSKLTNKETYEYFLKEYPALEKFNNQKPDIVKKDDRRYTWGTQKLNESFALIKRGSYVLMVADQGMGKTTFAFYQARKNAAMGNKTLYLSLEMDNHEIADFLARKFAGITEKEEYNNLIPEYKKKLYEQKKKELGEIENLKLCGVSKGTDINMDFIKKEIAKHNPDIVYIDNFDLVGRMSNKDELINQKQKSAEFMNIASTMQIPIIVLHHNRKKQNGKSSGQRTIDDVGGSGKLTDDADRIVLLQRNTESQSKKEQSELTLILAKARGYDTRVGSVYFDKGDFRDTYTGVIEAYDAAKKIFIN